MKEKKCNKCQETKAIPEFAKDKCKKSGYSNRCKQCHREYAKQARKTNADTIRADKREYYKKNKKRILEKQRGDYAKAVAENPNLNKELYQKNKNTIRESRRAKKQLLVDSLGGECQRCGYSKCLGALDFHHLDPDTKEFEINSRSNSSFEKCLKEANKCVLLCANCHREEHTGGD